MAQTNKPSSSKLELRKAVQTSPRALCIVPCFGLRRSIEISEAVEVKSRKCMYSLLTSVSSWGVRKGITVRVDDLKLQRLITGATQEILGTSIMIWGWITPLTEHQGPGAVSEWNLCPLLRPGNPNPWNKRAALHILASDIKTWSYLGLTNSKPLQVESIFFQCAEVIRCTAITLPTLHYLYW